MDYLKSNIIIIVKKKGKERNHHQDQEQSINNFRIGPTEDIFRREIEELEKTFYR